MAGTRARGRTRIWRVVLGVVVFSALLFPQLSASATPDEALSDREYLGPSPADMQDPAVQAEIASDVDELEKARARRQQPDEVAAREASRTSFQDLTADQARDLAAQVFPELMLDPTWEGYEPPAGHELVRYYGSESALIKPQDAEASDPVPSEGTDASDPEEAGSLVESTVPLRVENEAGQLRPVDPELIDRGSYLEPANAAVEAELPETLANGIELPEAELSVEPQGAVEAAPAKVVGRDKVFWANVDTDTDFIAASTPTGVETFWQLRSERSPEQYSLKLDLPPGSSLEPALNGLAAEVIGADGPEAIVRPPLAFDADGVPVPVEMKPVGDELSLSIAHRAGDFKLPIILDPVVEVVDVWGWGTPCPYGGYSYPFWRWEQSLNAFDPGCSGDWGLVTQTRAGTWYPTNAYAQWVWVPPYDTFLERVEFYNTDFTHGMYDDFCSYHGIWSTQAYAWQSLWGSCTPWAHTDLVHQVGQGGHDNNGAVFQLYSPGDRVGWQLAWTAVRAAKFVVSDRNNPTFSTATPPTQPWRDDTVAGTPQSFGYTATARDGGLGMKWLSLRRPDRSAAAGYVVDQRDRGCAGVQGAFPCTAQGGSYSQQFSYQLNKLPEGVNRIDVTAKDQIDRARTVSWQQPIDRSKPVLEAPTGSLVAQANNVLTTLDYDLQLMASDGGGGVAAPQTGAGVAEIEVFVDGASRFVATQTGCNSSLNSCPTTLAATWNVLADDDVFTPGNHAVRVVATDALGHESIARTFQITVRSDITEASVDMQATAPDTGGNFTLTLDVRDGNPIGSGSYGSGAERLELYVDGQEVRTFEEPCLTGGCRIEESVQLGPTASPAQHELVALAYDHAGNASYQRLGQKLSRFEWFGYGEGFDGFLISRAGEGGANIIRQGFDWCNIAANGYGNVVSFFNAVDGYNANNPANARDIKVVAILYNTPSHLRPSGVPTSCDVVARPASRAVVENDWSAFVTDFVSRFSPRGTIMAIEAWNEPNKRQFWTNNESPTEDFDGDPHLFARLVNVTSKAVASVDPSLLIFPGGLSPQARRVDAAPFVKYMKLAMEPSPDGFIDANKVDGLSAHFYADGRRNNRKAIQDMLQQYADFRMAVPDAFNIPGIGHWITEIGAPSIPGGPSTAYAKEQTQRQRLRELYFDFAQKPKVRSYIVHRLLDDEKGFGVVRNDATRSCKLIYFRLADFVSTNEHPVNPACSPPP